MKLAVISVTRKGAELAERIAPFLGPGVDVYAKNGRNLPESHHTYDSLSDLVNKKFSLYDGLIFIMATGIVVRVIAAQLNDKRCDPAVVVMDDGGNYAISLLSGHIGGANELTRLVSRAAGAMPVITTATDVARLPAADVLAVKLNLAIEPFSSLKTINSAIVNGDRVLFFIDKGLAESEQYIAVAARQEVALVDSSEIIYTDKYDAAVVITDKELIIGKPHLYLRPNSLALGIGCRRDTTSAEILSAIKQACQTIGRSITSVAVIGSTIVKADEQGLLSVAGQLGVPIKFFTNEQLEQCINQYELSLSDFVNEKIGVGNVCEPAAMLAGRNNKLILPKTKYPKVTVAVTAVKYRWWE